MVVYPEFEFLKSRNGNIVATYTLPPARLDLPKFRDIPDTSKDFGTFFAYEPDIAKNFPELRMCLKKAAAKKRQVVLKGTWKHRHIEYELDEYLPDYSTIFCRQIAGQKDYANAVIGKRTII